MNSLSLQLKIVCNPGLLLGDTPVSLATLLCDCCPLMLPLALVSSWQLITTLKLEWLFILAVTQSSLWFSLQQGATWAGQGRTAETAFLQFPLANRDAFLKNSVKNYCYNSWGRQRCSSRFCWL